MPSRRTPASRGTDVVILETPGLRHAEAFLEGVRRSRKLHQGLVSPPSDLAAYAAYVQALRQENRASFLVMPAGSSDIAGVVNVSEIVRGAFQSAYLGYYAFIPHAGRGLISRGLRNVVRHCFDELKLHRLEANIQRDHERWAILAEHRRGRPAR